jgi:hypothetical protein
VTHDAHQNAEDPRLNGGSAVEIGQPPLDDDEHILNHVLRTRRGHAEAPSISPHEGGVLGVDPLE